MAPIYDVLLSAAHVLFCCNGEVKSCKKHTQAWNNYAWMLFSWTKLGDAMHKFIIVGHMCMMNKFMSIKYLDWFLVSCAEKLIF